MKKEILTLYELTKTKIQREIDGNRGRVAVTTDMWTATNQKREPDTKLADLESVFSALAVEDEARADEDVMLLLESWSAGGGELLQQMES
ncbi:hypothetical protein LINPERHAP1_LOCUS20600 [Linum perenne]